MDLVQTALTISITANILCAWWYVSYRSIVKATTRALVELMREYKKGNYD